MKFVFCFHTKDNLNCFITRLNFSDGISYSFVVLWGQHWEKRAEMVKIVAVRGSASVPVKVNGRKEKGRKWTRKQNGNDSLESRTDKLSLSLTVMYCTVTFYSVLCCNVR